jgi:hypothetical protein
MVEKKNNKGLGRGLMSLFGDQNEEISKKTHINNPYLLVSIGNIVRNKFQPRNYFDEKKIEELSQSIKKKWNNSTNCS